MQALSDIHDGAIVDLGVPRLKCRRGPAFRCKSAAVKCTACGLFAAIRHALTLTADLYSL